MKKILLCVCMAFSLVFGNINCILADCEEDIMPLGEVLCDVFGSQHKLIKRGITVIYDKNTGKILHSKSEEWSIYTCVCGICVACEGEPANKVPLRYYYEFMSSDLYANGYGNYICYVDPKTKHFSDKWSIRDYGYYFYYE